MARKSLGIILAMAVFGYGCGTIIHGSRQNVSIGSNPPGATATVGDIKVKTPATVSLAREKDYVVTVSSEGYESRQTTINREFNGMATILGNILWLLPGVIVDLWAGGAWTLNPEAVNVSLDKKK